MVTAISVVRDEDDVILETVGHMMGQVDRVIIADNLSTDGTREICEDLGAEVLIDDDPRHRHGEKMTKLAQKARAEGADWIVPFDADEIWRANKGTVKDVLNQQRDSVMLARAVVYTHAAVPSGRILDMDFRWKMPEKQMKVAGRVSDKMVVEDGNHWIDYEAVIDKHVVAVSGSLYVHHFPYRTAEQMIRKIRQGAFALKQSGLNDSIGAHWRGLDSLTDDQIRWEFEHRFLCEEPTSDRALVYDPVLYE